jgi:hypothetical protein
MSLCVESNFERLRKVDAELGTQTVSVYLAALATSKYLEDVNVFPIGVEEAERCGLSTTGETLFSDSGDIIVTFGVDASEYAPFIDGVFAGRFAGCRLYIDTPNSFAEKAARAIEVIFLHELGHVDHFGILGPEFSLDDYFAEASRHYYSLPLCAPTSVAISRWNANTGGYKTHLMNAGYTENSFADMLRSNVVAYGLLPSESYADSFAERVIGKIND